MPRDRSPQIQKFSVGSTREDDWYVAQCLEVDIASQGESEDEALANLRAALELFLEEPVPTEVPNIARIEVRTSAA